MRTLMQAALSMAGEYHTPVDYWLSLPAVEFMQWAEAAREMDEARKQKL